MNVTAAYAVRIYMQAVMAHSTEAFFQRALFFGVNSRRLAAKSALIRNIYMQKADYTIARISARDNSPV